MQTLFAQFTILAERKINHVLEDPVSEMMIMNFFSLLASFNFELNFFICFNTFISTKLNENISME